MDNWIAWSRFACHSRLFVGFFADLPAVSDRGYNVRARLENEQEASMEKEIVSRNSPALFQSIKQYDQMNPKPAVEEVKVPTDLRKALAAAPKAKTQWSDLTPIARRDFISWIDSAKQAETRTRRLERACSMLAAGKRRPCCYSIVSFDLFTALNATPKAKAQWSDLTPIERRDFIGWIDSAKGTGGKSTPDEKACVMLAAGKRRP